LEYSNRGEELGEINTPNITKKRNEGAAMNIVIIDIPCQSFAENVSKHPGNQLNMSD
jgi:hypothetical protein